MKPILREGGNCWRILPARRVAFLVDAAAYFDAFARSCARARESILIVGWDIDSRIRLFPEETRRDLPPRLSEFLLTLVARQRGLDVYILEWDFAVIYAFERELFPVFKLPWRQNRHIHFRLDSEHPLGSSHHQKITVIDDSVAFVGGIDLTRQRWDTPEHLAHDPRRIGPSGEVYGPFHDVQMAVDGNAAAALGDLVRMRWRRSTHKRIKPAKQTAFDPWPPELPPDLEDVRVAVVRTDPGYGGRREVREVEALYLDAIASAQRFIYMENQYLTSFSVARALTASLQKRDGPEIVIVLRVRSDWLEETTMGAFRARVLAGLRQADTHGRLRVYYPEVPHLDGKRVNLHSKVMIADDTLLRVGSSNLSNRSMGVDTECDLALESRGEERIEKGIARFRNRLLGEHLGVPAEETARIADSERSLIRSIEKLRSSGRTLVPFPEEGVSWTDDLIPETAIDPVEPIDPEKLVREFIPREAGPAGKHRLRLFILFLLALCAIAAAWRWTPLGDWIDWSALVTAGHEIRENTAAPFIVIAAYVAGSLIMFPVTVMIMATAFTFSPLGAFSYSLSGCVLAAGVTYGVGRVLGRDIVGRLSGSRVKKLSRRLAQHGVIAVGTVRLLPVAPFTVVNLVAGASHIRFWDFVFGTVLGMAPGIGAITLFGHQLGEAISEPGLGSFALLGILVCAMIVAVLAIKSRLIKEW
jgi:phospholipase D1/2